MNKNHLLSGAAVVTMAALLTLTPYGYADLWSTHSGKVQAAETGTQISPGLVMPPMDPVRGKKLFASKGCVVCHAVNGVGGTDAPVIDASRMDAEMSPFDFFVKMWNHSVRMIDMQNDELGRQTKFRNGQELADIVAFLHDAPLQKTFSEADIPDNIKDKMDSDTDGNSDSKPKTGMGGKMDEGMGSMMNNDKN